ncbi:hypothetical protein K8T06_16325, partial [bacterium]|nr:hypothetical protein [bacterium]
MKTTLPIIVWMMILLPLGIAADVPLEGVSVVGQATVELPANQVRLKTSVHESAKEAMTAQSMLEKRTR